MEHKLPSEMTWAERHEDFHAFFGPDTDPAQVLVDLVRSAGHFLAAIVGDGNADVGMAAIIGPLSEGRDWRQDLEENAWDAYTHWDLGAELYQLTAYAFYGIDLFPSAGEDQDAAEARIEARLNRAEAFAERAPLDLWLGKARPAALERTVTAARARWSLDHNEGLTPEGLALIGGVSLGRMRNMLAAKPPAFRKTGGLIPADQAKVWLDGRKEYVPTLWQMAESEAVPTAPVEAPIFVPVARDGSCFHPGLARHGRFTIGEKYDEEQVEGYEAALQRLQRMPRPVWRRPGKRQAGWGLVVGTSWARFAREDLDLMAGDDEGMVSER